MAYGTPRATKVDNELFCVPCTRDMYESGTLTVKGSYPGEEVDMHKKLAYGDVNVQDTLLEGQYPDQRILEEHECKTCHKLLRDDCTDY